MAKKWQTHYKKKKSSVNSRIRGMIKVKGAIGKFYDDFFNFNKHRFIIPEIPLQRTMIDNTSLDISSQESFTILDEVIAEYLPVEGAKTLLLCSDSDFNNSGRPFASIKPDAHKSKLYDLAELDTCERFAKTWLSKRKES